MVTTLFVLGLKSCHILLLSLECEDCQSGTNGGPRLTPLPVEGPMRHLAGMAGRGSDLLRGADHDL